MNPQDSKPPIDFVFMHGGGQGSWIWSGVIHELQSKRGPHVGKIIALDIPGCGEKRGRDLSALTLKDVVNELTNEIDAAQLHNAYIVGHSMAGIMLSELVAARPSTFDAAIFVTCAVPLPNQSIRQMMGHQIHGADPLTVGWPLDPQTTAPRDLFRAMFCNDMEAEAGETFLDQLGADSWPDDLGDNPYPWCWHALTAVKTFYVVAEHDMILPPAWQRKFAQRINATIHSINAGHQPMQTQAAALAELLWKLTQQTQRI